MKYAAECKPMVSGLLEVFILSRASKADVSGKSISAEISSITGCKWKPSPGTVYPLLAKLADSGLIKVSNHTGREVVYSITSKGLQVFKVKQKILKEQGDSTMPVVVPVLISIIKNLDASEMQGISRDVQFLQKLRNELFSMPSEKRIELINKISKLIK